MTILSLPWLKHQLNKYKPALLAGMASGLLTHMFAFTNKLVNHDEIYHMFDKGATLSSGRWGLDLLPLIFPDFSMPWIYGIISIILITLSACLVISIFDIKKSSYQILLAGLFASFPSLIATFTYMFTAASYALSFFLSVLSVKLLISNRVIMKITSAGILIFSLSIYQSYLSMTATLLLLYMIQKLIHDEKPLTLIKRGLGYLGFLAVSLLIYYIITQLLLTFSHHELNHYANNALSTESSILERILLAYTTFWRILRNGLYGLVPSSMIRIVHFACLFVVAIKLLTIWWHKNLTAKILLPVLCALLPLSINCIFLISDPGGIHTLVLYGFCSIYVFMILIANTDTHENHKKLWLTNHIKSFLTAAMLIIMISNVYLGNQVYLCLHMRYENAYAFYTSVITTVKNTPGFDENSKLALIGSSQNQVSPHFEFSGIIQITGSYGFSVIDYSKFDFIKRYLGFDIQEASDEEIQQIENSQEYIDMPEYPYYGSVKKINGCIVVKFGNS